MDFQKDIFLSLIFSLSVGLLIISISGYSYATSYETYEDAIIQDDVLDDLLLSVCVAGTSILPMTIDDSILEEACSTIDPSIRTSIATEALENVVSYITSSNTEFDYELETSSLKAAIIQIIPSSSLKSIISSLLPATIPLSYIVSVSTLDSIRSDISMLSYIRFLAMAMALLSTIWIYKMSEDVTPIFFKGFGISVPFAIVGLLLFSQVIKWDVNRISLLSSTSIGATLANNYITTYLPLTFLPCVGAALCIYFSRRQKVV